MKKRGFINLRKVPRKELFGLVGATLFKLGSPIQVVSFDGYVLKYKKGSGSEILETRELDNIYKPIVYRPFDSGDDKYLPIKASTYRLVGRFLAKDEYGRYITNTHTNTEKVNFTYDKETGECYFYQILSNEMSAE